MKTIKDFSAADIALADCTAYHTARANTDWTTGEAAAQNSAIVRAWDYIRLQPFRLDIDIFADGLPEDIKQAAFEAALIEIQAPGALLKTKTEEILEKRIDVISTKYMAGATIEYQKLNALLAPYLEAAGVTLTR